MGKQDILENYEQTLRELQQLQENLGNKSNNYVKKELLRIIESGWEQIKTMYGMRDIKSDKEKLQKQFDEMLRLAPMTRVNKKTNDNT